MAMPVLGGCSKHPPAERGGFGGRYRWSSQEAPAHIAACRCLSEGSWGDSGSPGEGTSLVSSLGCCCWVRPGSSADRWVLGSLMSHNQKKGLWPSCFPAGPLRHSLPRFPCPPARLVAKIRGPSSSVLPGTMG